jgi:branched-subunit amino acid transport protein
MTGIWVAVLVTAAGCYALKLTGLVVPRGVLGNPRVRRFAELVPIALLAALVAVQTFAAGQSLTIDPARLAGLGAAVAALLLRAPFLVVIVVAAGTAARWASPDGQRAQRRTRAYGTGRRPAAVSR